MKLNWGTGIFIFLLLFLGAAAVFITFAMRQEVNLVHEDYYEKGVDYGEQLNAEARSLGYRDSIQIDFEDAFMILDFRGSDRMAIDSGEVYLYRPSSSTLDMRSPFDFAGSTCRIPRQKLSSGRYILKLSWYMDGTKYEVDKAFEVP